MDYRAVLEDLQQDILRRLSLMMGFFSLAALNLALIARPFLWEAVATALVMLLIAVMHNRTAILYPRITGLSFVVCLHGVLFALMSIWTQDWIPFSGLLLILIGALLVPYSAGISALLTCSVTLYLNHTGHADYPLLVLIILCGLMVVIANTVRSVFYVTVSWYSTMHQRAEDLLGEARDRRAELVQLVKSLNFAYQNQSRMQQQLIAARQQANEARRMKERFAANISHELRTPLNLILGFSEILYFTPEVYGRLEFPPKLYRDIHQIYNNSRHLLEMIDNVLDLSHIELSEFTMNFEPTDLNIFLADAVEMLQNFFKGHTVRFVAEIESQLPIIELDRTRIRQVLLNLISNSQRFTERGVVKLCVRHVDNNVRFVVEDTGLGIPADKLPHIFNEFFQVDYSLSRLHGGAGLGLAVSKRFIEAHQGQISVASAEGAGSTFTFTLPVRVRRWDVGREATYTTSKTLPTLIVIDPDPAIGTIIQRYLPQYHVEQVDTPNDLESALVQMNALVVIHNVHPHQPPELLQNITIPVLQCSLPSTAWLVRELGVAACLAKPITVEQLTKQIQQFPQVHHILVVDDELGFVQLVQRTIETLNGDFHVSRAYDGAQALDIISQSPPDLILLDLAMPDMTGFEVIEAIRASPGITSIPIVLLTATRYVQEEISIGKQMIIHRDDGLTPSHVIRCLGGVLDALCAVKED